MLEDFFDRVFGGDLSYWANVSLVLGFIAIVAAVVALQLARPQLQLPLKELPIAS
jgi:hypothetical protein